MNNASASVLELARIHDPADAAWLAQAEADSSSHPWSEDMYRSSISSDSESVFLLHDNGEKIGAAVLMLVVDEAHLHNIFVLPARQGQGMGKHLLQRLLQYARDHHTNHMLLEVRQSNERALALYRSCGFTESGRRKNYYRVDQTRREDAILMEATP